MPTGHSIIISEPLGTLAGFFAGRAGSDGMYALSDFVLQNASPNTQRIGRIVSAGIGAGTGHLIVEGLTKAAINTGSGDVGLGYASTAITTPTTSVAHGVLEAIYEGMQEVVINSPESVLSPALRASTDEKKKSK